MGILSNELRTVRGYVMASYPSEGIEFPIYQSGDYGMIDVMDSIVTILTTLVEMRFPTVDISEELTKINAKWGPDIREGIYEACKKLLNAAGVNCNIELAHVRNAHYGSEMREPLYKIFYDLGADDDVYTPTTPDDYIYIIDNNEAELIYYIGEPHQFISIPDHVILNGNEVPVTKLAPTLFNDNNTIMGIEIPNGVEVIS